MYVNPFWFGVGVTIAVELVLLVALAVWVSMADGGEEE